MGGGKAMRWNGPGGWAQREPSWGEGARGSRIIRGVEWSGLQRPGCVCLRCSRQRRQESVGDVGKGGSGTRSGCLRVLRAVRGGTRRRCMDERQSVVHPALAAALFSPRLQLWPVLHSALFGVRCPASSSVVRVPGHRSRAWTAGGLSVRSRSSCGVCASGPVGSKIHSTKPGDGTGRRDRESGVKAARTISSEESHTRILVSAG